MIAQVEGFNAQNIPEHLRKLWKPVKPGHVLVQADWKQIEAGITAWDARDKEMTEAILDGADLHAINAASIYGCAPTTEAAEAYIVSVGGKNISARQAGKFTHKANYGMRENLMARTYGIPVKECKRIIDTYLKRWPAIPAWQERTVIEAMTTHCLRNAYGFMRFFYAMPVKLHKWAMWDDANEALATPAQSTGAEMLKDVLRGTPNEPLYTTTHDSVALEVRDNLTEIKAAGRFLKGLMETPVECMKWPPFYPDGYWCKVELTVGLTWGDKEALEV